MPRIASISENSIEYVHKLLHICNNGDCSALIERCIP